MEIGKFYQTKKHRILESYLESLGGLLLLLLGNYLFYREDMGFLSVNPHPFLFLTILIASRYGVHSGLLTAGISSMVFLAFMWDRKDISTVISSFAFTDFIPVYLFVIMAIVLGHIRDLAEKEIENAVVTEKKVRDDLEQLKMEYDALKKVKDELQERILSATDPLHEFYEAVRGLTTLDPNEVVQSVVTLTARFTGATKVTLYMAKTLGQEEVFERRSYLNWETPDEFDIILKGNIPIIRRAIEEQRVVTLEEIQDKKTDIMMCCPIIGIDTMKPIGIIAIHRIPFIRITRLAIDHLQTIAKWAGQAMSEVGKFEKLKRLQGKDLDYEVLTYEFLASRLEQEVMRVNRYGGVCSFLLIGIVDIDSVPLDDKRDLIFTLGKLLSKELRMVDVIGLYRIPDVFGVILPSTPMENAVIVAGRINERFHKDIASYGSRFGHLRLKMGLSTTSSDERLSVSKIFEVAEHFGLTRYY